jgi:hypothetical protein
VVLVSLTFLLTDPFWVQKIMTDPCILALIYTECLDDRHPKFDICISELIFVLFLDITCHRIVVYYQ